MIATLLLLASLASAQSTTTFHDYDLDRKLVGMSLDIRDFQQGHPTLTGKPTYQGGFSATGNTDFAGVATFSSATFNGWVSVSSNVIGSLRQSSATINVESSDFTNTAFSICQSTLTIYTQGQPVELYLDAFPKNGTANAHLRAVVLQDGQFITDYNPTWSVFYPPSITATRLGGSRIIPAPAAGLHTYCVGYYTDVGTGGWGTGPQHFYVRELP